MADQDGLVQVGSELTLEEPMAQDDTLQEDLPLQSNPEVTLGAAAAMHEASPGSFDMRQMLEIIMQRMDANAQKMEERMGSRMDTNAQEMNENMQTPRGDMQNVVRNFANRTRTLRK